MALIADFDLELSSEDVLGRLMLGGRAFRARPAAVMVAGLLARLREEQLLRPQASYRCVALRHGSQAGFDPEAAGLFEPGRRLSQRSRAGFIVAAVWSLGPDVSRAIADGFRQRRALQALVLDEIASLLVFRLGEQLFARLRQQLAVQGLGVGRPQRPGDGVVTLGAQAALLQLAGAGEVGVTLAGGGVLSPLKTGTALAAVGQRVRQPRQEAACAACASRAGCRLRARGRKGIAAGASAH